MRRWRTSRAVLLGATLALLWLWTGCNGDGGGVPLPGPGPQQPPLAPAGPVTVVGRIVNATSMGTGVASATVQALGFGIVDTSAFDGGFRLEGLPYGPVELRAEFPIAPSLRPQNVTVHLSPSILDPTNPVYSLTIAALPVTVSSPARVQIIPGARTVGVRAQIDFDVQVFDSTNNLLNVEPTWTISGGIGTVGPTGVFTAGDLVATGNIIAQASTALGFATVNVIPAGPPTIQGLVATPQSLPATGGDVLIACYVEDADGLFVEDGTGTEHGEVVADLRIAPGGLLQEVPMFFQGARPANGTTVTSGTWAATFTAPGNSNPIQPGGIQDPQVYEVRVRAVDLSNIPGGDTAVSSPITFEVRGADQPPPIP